MKERKSAAQLTAALAGNPNCGKTTLFNALTGSDARVGNWPGVTVERRSGRVHCAGRTVELVDLPGVYSLVPYSPEEALAGKYLTRERPDLIINIVDASNLERSLYLTTQLMELKIPMVVALNMMDVAEGRGDRIDCARLSSLLNMPVLPVSAAKGEGISALMKAAVRTAGSRPAYRRVPVPPSAADRDTAIADARYRFIGELLRRAVKTHPETKKSLTERIDTVATNRVLAIPVFLCLVLLIFWLTFGPFGSFLARCAGDLLARGISPAADGALRALGAAQWTRGLVVDGVIAGVGAVLRFLPQILVLFFLLSILEDSGYMARAAFIMDAPMRRLGLSGRAFVPLLMGFGCTVPAAMGTRILENEKDKRLTILILPFMSCSAKMPVYALFIAAFFPGSRTLAMLSLYLLGILLGIGSALLLKNSVLKGEPAPFVMELPDYRLPTPRNLWLHVRRRVWDFLHRAGTTVFAATVAVWMLQSVSPALHMTSDSAQSLLAAAGRRIAPLFSLCGFGTWKPVVALLAGLVAKESIVGALGVLYPGGLTESLQANFSTLSACSFLIFTLLYTPCAAALGAIRRETGSLKWTAVCALYQFGTAWYCSALFYQCAVLICRIVS